MAQPSHSTVTIDGDRFDAYSTQVGISTVHDERGMPLMGSMTCSINVTVDFHDNVNLPFATLSKLFDLANRVTRDKIKDIKIEYWTDESRQDALCVYRFRGWISSFFTNSHGGSNHVLNLTLQPELDAQNFLALQVSN